MFTTLINQSWLSLFDITTSTGCSMCQLLCTSSTPWTCIFQIAHAQKPPGVSIHNRLTWLAAGIDIYWVALKTVPMRWHSHQQTPKNNHSYKKGVCSEQTHRSPRSNNWFTWSICPCTLLSKMRDTRRCSTSFSGILSSCVSQKITHNSQSYVLVWYMPTAVVKCTLSSLPYK